MKRLLKCSFFLGGLIASVIAGVTPAKASCHSQGVKLPIILRLAYSQRWQVMTVHGKLVPDFSSPNLIEHGSHREYTFRPEAAPLQKYEGHYVKITGCVGSFSLLPWWHFRQFFYLLAKF